MIGLDSSISCFQLMIPQQFLGQIEVRELDEQSHGACHEKHVFFVSEHAFCLELYSALPQDLRFDSLQTLFADAIVDYLRLFSISKNSADSNASYKVCFSGQPFEVVLTVPSQFPILSFSYLTQRSDSFKPLQICRDEWIIDPNTMLPRVTPFFMQLSAARMQHLLSLLLQHRLITSDMLRAIIHTMGSDGARVIAALPKKEKEKVRALACNGPSLTKQWIEQALFLVSINLRRLFLQKKRQIREFGALSRLQRYIRFFHLRSFFARQDLFYWIERLRTEKIFELAVAQANTLDWGRAAALYGSRLLSVLQPHVSKRCYADIEAEQQIAMQHCSRMEQLESCYALLQHMRATLQAQNGESLPSLAWYAEHIVDASGLYLYLVDNGVAEFVLALRSLPMRAARSLLSSFPAVAQSVVLDLLSGALQLNIFYGEKSELHAEKKMRELLFALVEEGMVRLSD